MNDFKTKEDCNNHFKIRSYFSAFRKEKVLNKERDILAYQT